MADVFISYKSERRAAASHLAEVLRLHGYSVWFDYGLLTGQDFGRQIERELRAAKACVVLWCSMSVSSDWVLDEARLAKELDTYTPCWLEKVGLPLGYGRADTIDLTPWDGAPRSAALDRLMAEVARRVGRPPRADFEGLRTYEDTWRRFGAPSLARFALGEAAETRLGSSLNLSPPPQPQPSTPAPPLPPPQPLPSPQIAQPAAGPPQWLVPAGVLGGVLALVLLFAANQPQEQIAPDTAPESTGVAVPAIGPEAPAPAAFVDARTTPASTRAPLVTNPASLPDFALFRECDGCPEMVVLPSGSFQMGSPAGEAGRQEDEDSQAGAGGGTLRVSIRRFAISRFETTWDQWTACVNAGACNQGPVDGAGGDNGFGRGSRPIIEVDWNDGAAYAIFIGGRAGAASAYRLPTEAEWEYAARAGSSTRWSFGDTESQLGAYAWFSSNSSSRTQAVGGKLANPWGLFDMHGNVWEWVEDCYNESYAATPQNGAANTTGGCASRVIRGGSWGDLPQYFRSAGRSRFSPTDRLNGVGFRLSRVL